MHRAPLEVIMKATITGNDSLSKRILLDLSNGVKVSEIPKLYPVSLDQVKKLSQFKKILDLTKKNLEEYYSRMHLLGIKSLPLTPLFRQSDWGGLAEILSVVTDKTRRNELQLLMTSLKEKRRKIYEFKEEVDLSLSKLEAIEKSLKIKEKELLQRFKEMNDRMNMFKKYPEPYRSFLTEYLGLYEGELVLVNRLNVHWQQSLQKDGIIVFDESHYVFFIKDFHNFVESLISRHKKGLEYRWNLDKDTKKLAKTTMQVEIPYDKKYKLPSALNEPFIKSINTVKLKLEEIKNEKLAIEQSVKEAKNKTVQSYIEMTEVSEPLSIRDLKRHRELQDKALKWLFQHGFVAVTEFNLPNGRKADIFAYNESQIAIFEIKVSYRDLANNQKWMGHLPYCHDFYFLIPSNLETAVAQEIKNVNCGQFMETQNSIQLIYADKRQVRAVTHEEQLKFQAAQLLSRKFIYGY